MSAVSWRSLATAEPDLAAAGEDLLRAFTLGYLATLRADGSPRVAPVTVTLHDGGLYVFVRSRTPKARDLLRDPRFALHSFPRIPSPASFDDEEFSVAGRAVLVEDSGLRDAVRSIHNDSVGSDDLLFRLDLLDAVHKHRVEGRAVYRHWRAP